METHRIEKGLVYTREVYEEIADLAKQEIGNLTNEDARIGADEYGIYYNALAGLLRAGVLCSRVTGTDGFPEIRIVSGSKSYQCREDVLRTVLGEEADFIISPYEDKFESYLDPIIQYNIPGQNEEDEPSGTDKKSKNDIKALKKEHRAEIDKLKKQYEDKIAALKADAKKQTVPADSSTPGENKEIASVSDVQNVQESGPQNINVTMPSPDNARFQAQIKQLAEEKDKLAKENEKLIKERAEAKDKISTLGMQLKQKTAALEEREKYHYDPVYDHYYSDELPALISSLESSKSDLIFKTIAIVGCVAGIAISAVTGFLDFLPF